MKTEVALLLRRTSRPSFSSTTTGLPELPDKEAAL